MNINVYSVHLFFLLRIFYQESERFQYNAADNVVVFRRETTRILYGIKYEYLIIVKKLRIYIFFITSFITSCCSKTELICGTLKNVSSSFKITPKREIKKITHNICAF